MNDPQPPFAADRRAASIWAAAAVVIIVFGLPLFTHLGDIELNGDEAIYAFSIDRMIDMGDWLTPRSIPDERNLWFEKPPLKFWIVAGSMRLGLLPHDEFGMRFWDATFGLAAFLYVLAIGYRMSGVICGLTAVLVLFTHQPLVLDHGLRSNNMEAGLLLAYCAGAYHAMAWADAVTIGRRWRHGIAVALWFAFGFMLKFVAALFLPAIIVTTTLISPRWRRRMVEDWRIWGAAAVTALAVIAPWFVYQFLVHGREFWSSIFGMHVFVRFTAYLDPHHLKPWYFYLTRLAYEVRWSNDILLISAGLLLLVYRAAAKRSDSAILLLVWFVLPLAAISAGTSKLYHYVYPFLPPLALGAGLVPMVVFAWVRQRRDAFAALVERVWSRDRSERLPPVLRGVLTAVAFAALAVALITAVTGGIGLRLHGVLLFRNSTVSRPLIAATILLVVLGRLRSAPMVLVGALLLLAMPLDAYRNVRYLERREVEVSGAPMHALSDCLLRLQRTGLPRGVYGHSHDELAWRYAYYLRDAGWREENADDDRLLEQHLFGPGPVAPVAMTRADFETLRPKLARVDRMRRLVFDDDRVLLLPDGFSACSGITTGGTRAAGGE